MAKIADQSGEGEETPYDRRYATATEVDGLRRTVDNFMKNQEQRNETMALNLDQIMSYMSIIGAQVGVQQIEDKGSNVKGNDTFTALSQGQNGFTKESHAHMHQSIYTPKDATLANKQEDPQQPQGTFYYYDLGQTDWMHMKTNTPDPNQHSKGFTQGQQYYDVEYLWDDYPCTSQEIEAFNPFSIPPTKPTKPFQSTQNHIPNS
jgi:hypothetical protein